MIEQDKDIWTVVLLICAILTRETALLMAIAVFITALIQRWQRWYLFLLPMIILLFGKSFYNGFGEMCPILPLEKVWEFPWRVLSLLLLRVGRVGIPSESYCYSLSQALG